MDYKKLSSKYKKIAKLSNDKKNIEKILMDKYGAFEIPLYSIDIEDYTNDDEVNEKKIYKLFHIDNHNILKEIVDSFAIDDEDYTSEMSSNFDYDTLIAKHNAGQGISIVLESNDGQHVSNYKVYGPAQKLVSHLFCYIPPENLDTNINNLDYQFYLECLEENNFI